MKIAIATMWYNEEDFGPLFLKHYSYVDKIHLILDTDTTDRTREIALKYKNVEIEDFTFPDMMDDIIKVNKLNATISFLLDEFDWVYLLDADEFIFAPKPYLNERSFLYKQERQGYNLVLAKMFQVYRHISEGDLDINKPAILQRQHGDPDLSSSFNSSYIKPIIVRKGLKIVWKAGNHCCIGSNINLAKECFYGAHWMMAEPNIAIKRRIYGRKMRQSKRNLEKKLTVQHHHITEEQIRQQCEIHRNDPNVLRDALLGEKN